MKFDDRQTVRVLEALASCPIITKSVDDAIEEFFIRNPRVVRTKFAERFVAGLAIARLGKPSL